MPGLSQLGLFRGKCAIIPYIKGCTYTKGSLAIGEKSFRSKFFFSFQSSNLEELVQVIKAKIWNTTWFSSWRYQYVSNDKPNWFTWNAKRWFRQQAPNPESQKTKFSDEECYVKTENLRKQGLMTWVKRVNQGRKEAHELYEQRFRKFRVTFQ